MGNLAQEINPGTYVYYIRLDDDPSDDKTATYYGNLNEQLAKVCTDLAEHPILSTAPAINAIGFSQGGQFMRGYVERCNQPPVANLITFGSQHTGINEFMNCADDDWVCNGKNKFLKGQVWSDYAQSNLVPAQYYRNVGDLENYLEHSNFLADINNERDVKNDTYALNMKKLQKFIMYVFARDSIVMPKESGWFGQVNETTGENTKLVDTELYGQDWIGLKVLYEQDRLELRSTGGDHMQIGEDDFKQVFKHDLTLKKDSLPWKPDVQGEEL